MAPEPLGVKPFFLAVGALLITEVLAGLAVSLELSSPLLVLGLLRCVQIALFLFIAQNSCKERLYCIGLGSDQILPGIFRGLIWAGAFGFIVLFGGGILYLLGMNPMAMVRTRLPSDTGQLLLYLTLGGLIGPVAEEIFFRGFVYGFFRRWGIMAALLGSSLVFVLAHSVTGVPFTQMVGGLLFAVSYEIEGKLMAPITIHVTGNSAIFALSLMAG